MAMKMLFGYNFGKLSVAIVPAHVKQADKGDWQEIDPASLTDELQDAYQEYKDAYALALKRSETVAIQGEMIEEARGRFYQALSVVLPSVNFKMTIGEWRKLVKRGWLYAAD